MKIKAAVTHTCGQEFLIQEVEISEPKATEVLVKMVGCGVCHTDAVARDQEMPVPLPAVLGHGSSGIVEKVGPAVQSLKPGDHVVLTVFSCGNCEACLTGHPSQCEQSFPTSFCGVYKDGTKRLTQNGVELSTFFAQSSFATYGIGPAGENLSKISCIINERRAVGRRGLGAVMGSKNLKAIAIRGDSPVPLADDENAREARSECLNR
ncbi:MAG TPA: alcohol dehydrogenase catalytic domain-containing protein [Desulfosporosinus sp.]|nr:alcohol dehydrogenase catalytic domain-containing protein [Desulfosporosinus sp.]